MIGSDTPVLRLVHGPRRRRQALRRPGRDHRRARAARRAGAGPGRRLRRQWPLGVRERLHARGRDRRRLPRLRRRRATDARDRPFDWRIVAAPAGVASRSSTPGTRPGSPAAGATTTRRPTCSSPRSTRSASSSRPRRTEPLYAFPGMFVTNMSGVPLGHRPPRDRHRPRARGREARGPRARDDEGHDRACSSRSREAETMLGAARAYVVRQPRPALGHRHGRRRAVDSRCAPRSSCRARTRSVPRARSRS